MGKWIETQESQALNKEKGRRNIKSRIGSTLSSEEKGESVRLELAS